MANKINASNIKNKLLFFISIDKQIAQTLLFRVWQLFAGAIIIFLIPNWLSPIEQGYFYAFSSLLALQIFFELGLSQVIVQFIAHEFSKIEFSSNQNELIDNIHSKKLANLIYFFERTYRHMALLFFIIVSIIGLIYFSLLKNDFLPDNWILIWLILTVTASVNLYLTVYFSIEEAFGQVAQVAKIRTIQSIIGHSLLGVAVVFDQTLWAMIFISATSAIFSSLWLYLRYTQNYNILQLIKKKKINHNLNWKKEIFPLQWRIALSWMCGYFIFQLFVPVAFATQGAVEAGKLGLSISIFSALLTVSMSWINAKIPVFSTLVAAHQRDVLNKLFYSLFFRSISFYIFEIIVIFLFLYIMSLMNFSIINRISDISILICLGLASFANCIIFSAAVYMRAHKEEPMIWVSLTSSMLMSISIYWAGNYGVFHIVFFYLLINVVIVLPWTLYLFLPFTRRTR